MVPSPERFGVAGEESTIVPFVNVRAVKHRVALHFVQVFADFLASTGGSVSSLSVSVRGKKKGE